MCIISVSGNYLLIKKERETKQRLQSHNTMLALPTISQTFSHVPIKSPFPFPLCCDHLPNHAIYPSSIPSFTYPQTVTRKKSLKDNKREEARNKKELRRKTLSLQSRILPTSKTSPLPAMFGVIFPLLFLP